MTTDGQLPFLEPRLSDREWIAPLLRQYGNNGSESAFGTLFIWCDRLSHRVLRWQDSLLVSFGNEETSYHIPLGPCNLREAVELLMADARSRGQRFRMWGMDSDQVQELTRAMPGVFDFVLDRDGSDYIYSVEQMITLAGRKLHRKRNHLRRFHNQYSHVFETIDSQNVLECQQFVIDWLFANAPDSDDALHRETCALLKALRFYEELDFTGGLIRVDGKVVAFTFGEEINSETFLIHFEKAQTEYDGVYAAINQGFAERFLASYSLVNREEDMGIPGLRKAKESYYPLFLHEKYVATIKGEKSDD